MAHPVPPLAADAEREGFGGGEPVRGPDEPGDGLADDDDTSVTGAATWYRDADGDTFGSATTTTACTAPSGYVLEAADCDDLDAAAFPGRNDRGGSSTGAVWVVYGPLAGTIDLDSADAEILGTTPYGYLGYGVTFVPDVNGDGFDEVAVGSFSAEVDGLPDRGGVWIFLGG